MSDTSTTRRILSRTKGSESDISQQQQTRIKPEPILNKPVVTLLNKDNQENRNISFTHRHLRNFYKIEQLKKKF